MRKVKKEEYGEKVDYKRRRWEAVLGRRARKRDGSKWESKT